MSDVLPQGTLVNGKGPEHEIESTAFKNMVEKSKQNLNNLDPVLNPPKRGRGRPRKAKASDAPAPGAPSVTAQPSLAGPVQAPDITNYLIQPIRMLSKIPAANLNMPDLALTPDEAEACAYSLNQLLMVFVPDIGSMSPKTAAVIAAFSTMGSIGFNKYQIYLREISKINQKSDAPVENPGPQPSFSQPFPVVDAAEHFRKQI